MTQPSQPTFLNWTILMVSILYRYILLTKMFLILLVDYLYIANCCWCHNFGLPFSAASCPWTQEFFLLPWLALVSFLGDNTYDILKNWFWRRKNLFLGEYVLSPRPSLRTHPFVKGMHQIFWVLGFGQEPAVLICVKRRCWVFVVWRWPSLAVGCVGIHPQILFAGEYVQVLDK